MNKTIQIGILTSLLATSAFAAGIDRSGQDISILFEEGRLMTLGMSFAQPDVTGIAINTSTGTFADTGNAAGDYFTASLGYKADLGDFSYALIYDQPFGALADYSDGDSITSGVSADFNSHALTLIAQYNINDRISIYGGARVQTIQADLSLPFATAIGYEVSSESHTAYGYLIGAAYEIPEIALRLDVTYNSAIEHKDINISESIAADSTTTVETPQSINANFQTGINDKTLVFGGVRWVDWSEFNISTTIPDIVDYEEDSVTYTVGIARKLNESFSVAASVAYEASSDLDSSFLSPTNGKTSYSLGGVYTVGNSKIQAGVSYVSLGDAEVISPASGSFTDNSAIGFGLKLTQSF